METVRVAGRPQSHGDTERSPMAESSDEYNARVIGEFRTNSGRRLVHYLGRDLESPPTSRMK